MLRILSSALLLVGAIFIAPVSVGPVSVGIEAAHAQTYTQPTPEQSLANTVTAAARRLANGEISEAAFQAIASGAIDTAVNNGLSPDQALGVAGYAAWSVNSSFGALVIGYVPGDSNSGKKSGSKDDYGSKGSSETTTPITIPSTTSSGNDSTSPTAN